MMQSWWSRTAPVTLADGLSPRDAAVKAMNEITGPVIATTLVLLAVFVPTAFMGGITGQLNRQFALTISSAVIISTINALTSQSSSVWHHSPPAPRSRQFFLFRWFNKAFDGCDRRVHRHHLASRPHRRARDAGVCRTCRRDRVDVRQTADRLCPARRSGLHVRQRPTAGRSFAGSYARRA